MCFTIFFSLVIFLKTFVLLFFRFCCCSIAKLCLTLCNPMDCSTPDFPVLHCLLESKGLSRVFSIQFSSVQSLSSVRLFATPWTIARQASLSITNSWSPPRTMSIVSVMPSNHLILSHPLLLLPSIFPSIWVFSNESALRMRWPKYWSFSFNISPSNEHPGLIFFKMNWFDLLAVQGTLKSLLQHHSSKDQFFGTQLSSQSSSHIHTWRLEKPQPWLDGSLLAKQCLYFWICYLGWS